MRLFVAIDLDDRIARYIFDFIKPFKRQYPEISWTQRENIHLTIKFLGETRRDTAQIKDSLQRVTEKIDRFDLYLGNFGYFDGDQLIVWQGFKLSDKLLKLIRGCDRELDNLGFKKERREYFPHVTIGRGKRLAYERKKEIKESIKNIGLEKQEKMAVNYISLIESKLSRMGATYNRLLRLDLRKSI